ncbi:MAG: Fic family protein [Desulfobacterales bacterium]
MATPHEKLGQSLEILKKLQEQGKVAIRSKELTRTHRECLVKNGFLQQVISYWYILSLTGREVWELVHSMAPLWDFCAAYLNVRFGLNWCLRRSNVVDTCRQYDCSTPVTCSAPKARNKITMLPYDTSILDIRGTHPKGGEISEKDGLRLFSVSEGLVICGSAFFIQNPTDARAALAMISNASDILVHLLEGGRSTVAGRLAGAFRNVGRDRIADDIVKTMQAAGYDIREKDPFENTINLILSTQEKSPYVNRLYLMWEKMRESIIKSFPTPPDKPGNMDGYLKKIDDIYASDAYHSLSIEGYRVNPELIQRVRRGDWDPVENREDREHHNALAARGYWQAYQLVRKSVRKVLEGENPGTVCDTDHGDWYREMFSPLVTAGLLRPAELAGYRNTQVYIRQSMHVPVRYEAVRNCMPAFFDLLINEPEPSVRIVLGHFVFVYIHPYMDGNGRIGRFLMNVMLAAGGYPWMVIPVEKRNDYMDALENASVRQDIKPFATFLGSLVLKT